MALCYTFRFNQITVPRFALIASCKNSKPIDHPLRDDLPNKPLNNWLFNQECIVFQLYPGCEKSDIQIDLVMMATMVVKAVMMMMMAGGKQFKNLTNTLLKLCSEVIFYGPDLRCKLIMRYDL